MSENIDYPTLKADVKWKNHPSILALVSEHRYMFFRFISKEDIFRETKKKQIPRKQFKRAIFQFKQLNEIMIV